MNNWLTPIGLTVALFLLYKKYTAVLPPPAITIAVPMSQRPEKAVSDAGKQAFIAAIRRYAPDIEKRYGIKPIITISQACLESTYGSSGLAREAKNLYGIKISRAWEKAGLPVWTGATEEFIGGKSVLMKDRFKKYSSWQESINDWAELISKVYKTAYAYAKTGDVGSYGQAIVNTGYSTHPQYASLLLKTTQYIG